MLEFKFDTQLLIDGRNLSEDEIFDYITKNIEGDCLLAVGDESLIKIHFHTNTPWKVLEYAASLGEIYDIVIENMERQEQGLSLFSKSNPYARMIIMRSMIINAQLDNQCAA